MEQGEAENDLALPRPIHRNTLKENLHDLVYYTRQALDAGAPRQPTSRSQRKAEIFKVEFCRHPLQSILICAIIKTETDERQTARTRKDTGS